MAAEIACAVDHIPQASAVLGRFLHRDLKVSADLDSLPENSRCSNDCTAADNGEVSKQDGLAKLAVTIHDVHELCVCVSQAAAHGVGSCTTH